jgi:hypothetical protein
VAFNRLWCRSLRLKVASGQSSTAQDAARLVECRIRPHESERGSDMRNEKRLCDRNAVADRLSRDLSLPRQRAGSDGLDDVQEAGESCHQAG